MKARSAKAKGQRLEKKVTKLFEAMGWRARRQPGSGVYQGFEHDNAVEHPLHGPAIIECKKRAKPLLVIRRWLGHADMLVVEEDYERDPLIVMRMSVFRNFASYDQD